VCALNAPAFASLQPPAQRARRTSTIGLTLGKYAPLHRGHQFVIETALKEMDDVIVLIYDSPETTDIPLHVRSGWIRALYPSVRVVEAWDGPTGVGYSPDEMRAHEAYVLSLPVIADGAVTHFYSSEPYGAHMSHALRAVDRRVDGSRKCFPISATMIREHPFAHRDLMDPIVYRDLVLNVVLLGAPCTGKSTLAQRLASVYHTRWMPEYGREYWETHQVDRRLTPDQLIEIAEGHLEREEAALQAADRYLFTDTNAWTTATFARYYHGEVPPGLVRLADRAALRYDLAFVCDTDVPYDDTWDRSGAVQRQAFQRQVIADLHERKVPYVMLRGNVDARVDSVKRLLSRFRKYMNVLDIAGARQP